MKVRIYNTLGALIGVCCRKRPEDLQDKATTPAMRRAVRKGGEKATTNQPRNAQ